MNVRLLITLLFLLCSGSCTCPGQQGSGSGLQGAAEFSIPSNADALVSLEGHWRFHPGDDPRWASTTFDDAEWPLLRSDTPWEKQGYEHLSGFAWYRFTVRLTNESQALRLLLPPILDGYEVFADGQKLGRFGAVGHYTGLLMPQAKAFDLPKPQAGQPLHIALRVWANTHSSMGSGPLGIAEVGRPSSIDEQTGLQHTVKAVSVAQEYAVALVEGTVGLTVLALYLFRRTEREYLWFALILLSRTVGGCDNVGARLSLLSIAHRDLIDSFLNPVFVIASLLFFATVLGARRTLVWRSCLVLAALDPLVVSFYIFGLARPATITALELAVTFPAELWILSVLLSRSLKGQRNAQLLVIPSFLVYGLDVLDHLTLSSMEFGWQARIMTISQIPIPIPLYPATVGNATELIFVFSLLAFLIRRFAHARALEQRYSSDLEAARSLQRLLIPAKLPETPGLTIATAYWPAQEVGGDFFQITKRGENETLVVVGDVAGKGVAAAMTVSLLIGSIRSLGLQRFSPATLLKELNGLLVSQGAGFTTAIAMSICPNGSLRLANAGHPPPYHNGEEILCAPALPLGLDPNAEFSESVLQLQPGDQVTLITDGVPEATRQRELFGFQRTQALSRQGAAAIAEAARAFGQADDITAVSVYFQSSGENIQASAVAP